MNRKRPSPGLGFAAGLFLVLSASLQGQPPGHGINRPGGDYFSFELQKPDPAECGLACARDGKCMAWTFVRPGMQGPRARCWLKATVPFPVEDNCCQSGVHPRAGETYQEKTDRRGGNYRDFDLNRDEPALCEAACVSEGPRFKAWTFVSRGVQGPRPRFWLKDSVPPSEASSYCVSGTMLGR